MEQSNLASARQRIETMEVQVKALAASNTQAADMSAVVLAHDKEVLSLRARIDELERMSMERETAVQYFTQKNANEALVERLCELEEANVRMESALVHFAPGRAQPEGTYSQLAQQEMDRAVSERDMRIGELERELAVALGRSERRFDDVHAENAHLKSAVSTARAELLDKESQLSEAEQRNANLQSDLEEAQTTISELHTALEVTPHTPVLKRNEISREMPLLALLNSMLLVKELESAHQELLQARTRAENEAQSSAAVTHSLNSRINQLIAAVRTPFSIVKTVSAWAINHLWMSPPLP